MRTLNYEILSDSDKLDLLKLLYHDLTNRKEQWTARDYEQRNLVVEETQRVYNRIYRGRH